MYECLRDHGVPADRRADGSVGYRAQNNDEMNKYNDIASSCTIRLAPYESATSSAVVLEHRYQVFTALHTCLTDAGFPMAGWPTQEVYVDSKGQYDVLDSTAPIDDSASRKACSSQFEAALYAI